MNSPPKATQIAPYSLPSGPVPFIGLSFLSDLSLASPAEYPDVLLLQARYHPHNYSEALFKDFDLPLPVHLQKAVKKRRAEYLASRVCVRYGLGLLGIDNYVLGNDADRAPIWPAGIGGSLSHTHQRISLLLAPAASGKLLGIDCEQLIRSETAKEMQEMIINADENVVLQCSGLPFATALTVAFSVKESLYKAIFPRLREFMDFNAAEIVDYCPATGTITLKLTRTFSREFPAGRLFTGHVQLGRDEVLSWIVTPQA